MKNTHQALLLTSLLTLLAGCGGGESSAAEGTPAQPEADAGAAGEDVLDTAADEVAMQKAELEEQIAGWEETLASKQKELDGLLERLKGLSPTELLGAEGKQLKLDSESLQQVIDELTKQIDSAKSQLASLGG